MMSLMNKFYFWRLLHIWLHKMTETSKGSYHVHLNFLQKAMNRVAFIVDGPADINFTSS